MPYILIDHTADIGIKVSSPTIESLYKEAARALVDLMGAGTVESNEEIMITAEGLDREDLLVRWLQEVLFLVEVKGYRLKDISIQRLTDTEMQAELRGAYSGEPLESEIKAVTYHNLQIREIDNAFEVSIIFDI
jgi:SHS2 domain-containing protein